MPAVFAQLLAAQAIEASAGKQTITPQHSMCRKALLVRFRQKEEGAKRSVRWKVT